MHSSTLSQPNRGAIEGAWRLEAYVRHDKTTAVTGILIMTAGWWCTLYFVPQPEGGGYWGSAESGRYHVKEDRLTFQHELTFQGGGNQPLVFDLASTTAEECRFVLTAGTLIVHFPSGSVIHCHRHSE